MFEDVEGVMVNSNEAIESQPLEFTCFQIDLDSKRSTLMFPCNTSRDTSLVPLRRFKVSITIGSTPKFTRAVLDHLTSVAYVTATVLLAFFT